MSRPRIIESVGDFRGPDGARHVVERGWDDELAAALPMLSLQPHILRSTPKDASRRFVDVESSNRWYDDEQKAPTPYSLRLGGLSLGGFIWMSYQTHADTPGCDYTSGFRMYQGAVGRGLARPFSEVTHDDFFRRHPGSGIWLETDEVNQAALALYDKLGYKEVANHDGRVVMQLK